MEGAPKTRVVVAEPRVVEDVIPASVMLGVMATALEATLASFRTLAAEVAAAVVVEDATVMIVAVTVTEIVVMEIVATEIVAEIVAEIAAEIAMEIVDMAAIVEGTDTEIAAETVVETDMAAEAAGRTEMIIAVVVAATVAVVTVAAATVVVVTVAAATVAVVAVAVAVEATAAAVIMIAVIATNSTGNSTGRRVFRACVITNRSDAALRMIMGSVRFVLNTAFCLKAAFRKSEVVD